MSMLDTVTCGLGGAIVLLLYMASQVPAGAKIVFDQQPPAPATGGQNGEGRKEPTVAATNGLVTVIFRYASDQSGIDHDLAFTDCNGQREALRTSFLQTPDTMFDNPNTPIVRWGYAVWTPDTGKTDTALPNCIKLEVEHANCQFRYISDAHYSLNWADCPTSGFLQFNRLDGGVFELSP